MNLKTLLLPLMLILPISSNADVVVIDDMATVVQVSHAPKAGMSKKSVQKRFGKPQRLYTAPGKVTKKNPRISVWTYANYKVFFENNHVVHTVVRQH